MSEHQKENAQKQVQKRYQLELHRYQKQIEKRNKVIVAAAQMRRSEN